MYKLKVQFDQPAFSHTKKEKGVVKLERPSRCLRRITTSAVFLSVSLVLKTAFSFHIPLFGQNGMSIGISGIFSMLPSILFGPVYGAVTSGLADAMGYLLKPAGPYIPVMTLIVAAGGFIRGALWLALRNRDSSKMRIAVAAASALMLASGICNIVFLSADGVDSTFYDSMRIEDANTDNMHLISRLLITRTINAKDPGGNLATYIISMTSGLIGSAVFGMLLLGADLFISRKFLKDAQKGQSMQLLIAMVVSGLIVTTLNTVLLRETIYTSWKALPFTVVWIPRVIEEILGNTVKAYFVVMLFNVFNRQRGLKELVRD